MTLKKEHKNKEIRSRRKIVSVPELLSARAELTSQMAQTKDEIDENPQEFEEFLILNKQDSIDVLDSNAYIKPEEHGHEIETEQIEIIDQKVMQAPSAGTISYNIPKNGVLVVTSDGNYVITSLDNNIVKKPAAPKVVQPQVEQIIILNGNDLQFTNMEMGCQDNGHTDIDQKMSIEHTISTDDVQTEEIVEEQYISENSIQQLEIVPADDAIEQTL